MACDPCPCPVPDDQQPLNQYRELQQSCFFSWALRPWPQLFQGLLGLWLGMWLVVGPVTAASVVPDQHLLKFLVMGSAGATVPVLLVFLQLYLSWRYVSDRLTNASVPYEESGWFDGQIWQKPETMQVRDRLIVTYELRPFLQRLERILGVFSLMVVGGTVACGFL